MNSFNFILNECGGVLARRVAAGVGLTRSDGQVVEREQGSRAAIPDISAINFSIDDNTILTNRGAVSVDKKPGRITLDFCRASSPLILFTESFKQGSLRILVASRILLKGCLRPISIEDGSP